MQQGSSFRNWLNGITPVYWAAIIFAVIGIAIGILGYFNQYCFTSFCASLPDLGEGFNDFVRDFYSNISMTFIGTSITVLVIDRLNEQRSKQLIIKRYQDEIDAFRSWKADEAGHRLAGIVRRLNAMGVSDIDLHNCYLRRTDLGGANLSGANLTKADLSSANLQKADLRRADLSRANLSNAILHDSDLREAILNGVDFGGADLAGADLREANLEGANLPV